MGHSLGGRAPAQQAQVLQKKQKPKNPKTKSHYHLH
jgi:hypothetical protein